MTAVEDITGKAAAPRVVDYGQFSFSVKRWALTALAEHVAPSVSSSDAVPVLACFRVRVGPDLLQLTGSNTVLSIMAESPAVSGPKAMVPASIRITPGPDGPARAISPRSPNS